MYRFIILYVMSQVYSAVTIQRHIYSHQISRLARADLPPNLYPLTERPFSQFSGNIGRVFANAPKDRSNYVVTDPTESKTSEKLHNNLRIDMETSYPKIVTDSYVSHTYTPMLQHINDYKKPRDINSLTKYPISDVVSGPSIEKLKYPSKLMNDVLYGYDGDFHNDEEDVRTSGRNTYDNYASFFYHNPYDFDHKDIDMEKAKDKRYADLSEKVIPVHEEIENDTYVTPTYEATTSSNDNPIGGNGPFFSFVLNDYFDRNHEEDLLSFKGLGVDWGKDFDHESYRPVEETKRDRRLEHYFTPVVQWMTTPPPNTHFDLKNVDISVTGPPDGYMNTVDHPMPERDLNKNYKYDNHDSNQRKYTSYKKSDGTGEQKYEGFKDFLDSFANKFGTTENVGESNNINEVNKDAGEKKKGFHRVYHKDEFLEDKEFYDNSNTSTKAADKGVSKYRFGGSEAILRSQALGAERHAAIDNGELNNVNYDNFSNSRSGMGDFNALENKFDTYINVAKQAAKSNNADYIDHYIAGV